MSIYTTNHNQDFPIQLYKDYRIFGDGNNELIIVATNPDTQEQEAFIIDSPVMQSLCMHQDITNLETGWPKILMKQIITDRFVDFHFESRKFQYMIGKDLHKMFDPIMKKSIRQLLSIVNKKFDERR